MMRKAILCFLGLAACAHARPDPDSVARRAYRLNLDASWDQALAELAPAIADAERRGDARAEARLRLAEGRVIFDSRNLRDGRFEAAVPTFEKARALADKAGDPRLLADADDRLGMVVYYRHFNAPPDEKARLLEEARLLFERARAQRESTDAPPREPAESHFHLGLVEQMAGRNDSARVHFERSLALAEEAGDQQMMSYALRHLADIDGMTGELARSEQRFARSLELRRAIGWKAGVVAAALTMSQVALERHGDVATARKLGAEALALADAIGGRGFATEIRVHLAQVDDVEGDLEGATKKLEAVRGDAAAVNDPNQVATVEERLGLIAVERGDLDAAAGYFGRAADAAVGDAEVHKQRARAAAVRAAAPPSEADVALFARFALRSRDRAAMARAQELAAAGKDAVLGLKLTRAMRRG